MASDLYVKFVLTVVAACLVLLVAQGFGLGAAEVEEPLPATAGPQRYLFVPVPVAGLILRLDQESGETWSMPIRGEKLWTPIAESSDRPAEPPQPEASGPADS